MPNNQEQPPGFGEFAHQAICLIRLAYGIGPTPLGFPEPLLRSKLWLNFRAIIWKGPLAVAILIPLRLVRDAGDGPVTLMPAARDLLTVLTVTAIAPIVILSVGACLAFLITKFMPPGIERALFRLSKRFLSPKVYQVPGSRIAGIMRFILSRRTYERVIEPQISDHQIEYLEAIANGRRWQSRWIWVRCILCVWWSTILLLPVSLTRLCVSIWHLSSK